MVLDYRKGRAETLDIPSNRYRTALQKRIESRVSPHALHAISCREALHCLCLTGRVTGAAAVWTRW